MTRLRTTIFAALFLTALIASCSNGSDSVKTNPDAETDSGTDAGADTLPALIVDSDMGLDDARVIVSLPLQDAFEVVAITTVEGAASATQGADNALRLLEAMGVNNVPVAVGSTDTVEGDEIPAPSWRAMAEGLGGLQLDPASTAPLDDDAVTVIRDLCRSREGVHILAIGPATNVVLALNEEPAIADNIAAVHLLGDFSACDGYNCYTDPQAGAALLAAGIPVYMVTPAVTDQLPFDADLLAAVQAIDAPAAELIAGFMASHATGSMKLWDDGVLASMLDENVIDYGDAGNQLHPSDDVDPIALETLLLNLWSELL